MGSINFKSNSYSGEVLEDLLVYTAHGCDTFENGLVHVHAGIQSKLTLPNISLGKIIQDNKPTPTSTEGQGDGKDKNSYIFGERYLEPQDFMIYLEFNPRDYEKYWKPFQPNGNLIFRELDPKVQSVMLRLLLDKKDEYIDDTVWCAKKGGSAPEGIQAPAHTTVIGGDSAAGEMKYFDGFIARVLTNISSGASEEEKTTGQVVIAGNTELTTGQQVEQALKAMWKKCPKKVRKSKKLKFVMGYEAWDLYDEYLTDKDFKYVENSKENKRTFKGKQIVVIDSVPENTIALGKFTTDSDSCLWMGVDYATDQEALKVDHLQNNSELYFFQMRLKMDVNIVLPSEIVVWTAYKNAV